MRLRPKPGRVVGGILIAVSTTVILAACSSSSTPSSTSSVAVPTTAAPTPTGGGGVPVKFNSCLVVSQAEAASAIGQSVTPGILGHATVEGGLACVFYGPSAPTPHKPSVAQPDSVRVVVVKGSDALTWYKAYKSSPGVRPQPIAGYGDQAYWDGYASLSVLKGDSYLRVAVAPAGAPPSLSDEKQLAAAILPKL